MKKHSTVVQKVSTGYLGVARKGSNTPLCPAASYRPESFQEQYVPCRHTRPHQLQQPFLRGCHLKSFGSMKNAGSISDIKGATET